MEEVGGVNKQQDNHILQWMERNVGEEIGKRGFVFHLFFFFGVGGLLKYRRSTFSDHNM